MKNLANAIASRFSGCRGAFPARTAAVRRRAVRWVHWQSLRATGHAATFFARRAGAGKKNSPPSRSILTTLRPCVARDGGMTDTSATKIFVGGLAWGTTSDTLREYCTLLCSSAPRAPNAAGRHARAHALPAQGVTRWRSFARCENARVRASIPDWVRCRCALAAGCQHISSARSEERSAGRLGLFPSRAPGRSCDLRPPTVPGRSPSVFLVCITDLCCARRASHPQFPSLATLSKRSSSLTSSDNGARATDSSRTSSPRRPMRPLPSRTR